MEAKFSISQVGVKYGILASVISVVYTVLLYVTGLYLNASLGYLSLIITIALLVFAFREYKSGNEGYMTLGEGFKIGMIVSLLSTVASAVFMYIYTKFIDPTVIDSMQEMQRKQMETQGLNDEQIEQAMSMTSSFMNPEFILMSGLIGGVIMSAIIVLIVAAIMKKNPDTI